MSLLRARWLGRLPYAEAWDLQRAIWEGRVAGRTPDDYLLLLEHPHVYTIGRNGDGSNVKVGEDRLRSLGADLVYVDRGGDVTYHGPGQLVAYPIRHLGDRPDVVDHVRKLEQVVIATLAEYGIAAWAEDGFTGVWTAAGKIAAIGVKTSREVTMHGLALNVGTELDYFGHIVPCGLSRPVTSMEQVLGRSVDMDDVVARFLPHFQRVFGYAGTEVQLGAFSRGASRKYHVDELVAAGAFSPNARNATPALVDGRLPGEPERPPWMKVKATMGDGYRDLKNLMRGLELNTVCEEAGCPNIYECWSSGTATLMLLGEVCTRACSFCDVTTGRPGEVDIFEPIRAAEAIRNMALQHAVLTSVNRDDLPDGGASVFADTIREVRDRVPGCAVEVLIPDFKGDPDALQIVMDEKPDVLNHNTETVLRLQRDIRTAANYGRSLALLARAKWANPAGIVKSGLIVGMGERDEEVVGALADLRAVGVDVVTIGQYLRPSARHRPVDRYVPPATFDDYAAAGHRFGIPHVESGPLVRSSYHAREATAAAVGG